MISPFNEQLKRMIRSYEKLPDDRIAKNITEDIKDDYFNFFIHCYHLKDWIIKDSAVLATEKQVEDYINKSKYLKIVGDVANKKKHLELTRSRQGVGLNIDITELGVGDDLALMIIYGNNEGILAHSLAIFAMQEWQVFLRNHGLPNFSFHRRLSNLL